MTLYCSKFAPFALIVLASCTQFPELDAQRAGAALPAGYPGFLPMDQLLAGAPARLDAQTGPAVVGRVAGLQARAERLMRQRSGHSGQTRARIAQLKQKAAALKDM
jgi:hypothetical protein